MRVHRAIEGAGDRGVTPTELLNTLRVGGGNGDGDGEGDGKGQVVWDEEMVLGTVSVLTNLGAVLCVHDFHRPRIVAVSQSSGWTMGVQEHHEPPVNPKDAQKAKRVHQSAVKVREQEDPYLSYEKKKSEAKAAEVRRPFLYRLSFVGTLLPSLSSRLSSIFSLLSSRYSFFSLLFFLSVHLSDLCSKSDLTCTCTRRRRKQRRMKTA
jgi:hypothetical protein